MQPVVPDSLGVGAARNTKCNRDFGHTVAIDLETGFNHAGN